MMALVRLLTWNLDGLGRLHVDVRTEAAVFLAITGRTLVELGRGRRPVWSPPDVLLLQEVTHHTFQAHLRPHLGRAGYVLHPAHAPETDHFDVVAVRAPARIVATEDVPLRGSRYGRELRVVDLADAVGGAPVRVITAHFDSGAPQSAVRVDGIRQVDELVAEAGGRAVFGGDANLRDVEWDDVADEVSLTDAWSAVGEPPAARDTWRMGERSARFDRVWLGRAMRATSMRAVGVAKLSPTVGPPSDHIGLLVDIADARAPAG